MPAISRKTKKGLLRYDDADDFDTFNLSNAEDLVPALVQSGNDWMPDASPSISAYSVRRSPPRAEGLVARIGRLQGSMPGDVVWRVITKDNTRATVSD